MTIKFPHDDTPASVLIMVRNAFHGQDELLTPMAMQYFRDGGVIRRLEKSRGTERTICFGLVENDEWEMPRLVEVEFVAPPPTRKELRELANAAK